MDRSLAGQVNVRISDDAGAIATLVMAATEASSGFRLVAEVSVESNALINAIGWRQGNFSPTRTRRTGLDLNANGRTFKVEAWHLDAADTITIDYVAFIPKLDGFDV